MGTGRLALIATATVALAACGRGSEPSESQSAPASGAATAAEDTGIKLAAGLHGHDLRRRIGSTAAHRRARQRRRIRRVAQRPPADRAAGQRGRRSPRCAIRTATAGPT